MTTLKLQTKSQPSVCSHAPLEADTGKKCGGHGGPYRFLFYLHPGAHSFPSQDTPRAQSSCAQFSFVSFAVMLLLLSTKTRTPFSLDQDDHFADLSDFLAQLVLQQLAFALHDCLDVADALVHRGESLTTLAFQLADLLGVPLDVSVHLGQHLGLNVLHKTTDANLLKAGFT